MNKKLILAAASISTATMSLISIVAATKNNDTVFGGGVLQATEELYNVNFTNFDFPIDYAVPSEGEHNYFCFAPTERGSFLGLRAVIQDEHFEGYGLLRLGELSFDYIAFEDTSVYTAGRKLGDNYYGIKKPSAIQVTFISESTESESGLDVYDGDDYTGITSGTKYYFSNDGEQFELSAGTEENIIITSITVYYSPETCL